MIPRSTGKASKARSSTRESTSSTDSVTVSMPSPGGSGSRTSGGRMLVPGVREGAGGAAAVLPTEATEATDEAIIRRSGRMMVALAKLSRSTVPLRGGRDLHSCCVGRPSSARPGSRRRRCPGVARPQGRLLDRPAVDLDAVGALQVDARTSRRLRAGSRRGNGRRRRRRGRRRCRPRGPGGSCRRPRGQ